MTGRELIPVAAAGKHRPPLLAFDKRQAAESGAGADPDQETIRDRKDDALVCAVCEEHITTRADALAMNERHEYSFSNPHGIRYRIGCFGQAPGCSVLEPGSLEWTWFPGYAWRIAVCRQCRVHLGWCFRAADPDRSPSEMFGLIVDRLVAED